MNEKNNGNIPPYDYSNDSGDSPNNKKIFPSVNRAQIEPNTEYSQILHSYQHIAKKDRSIQIIGGIFAFLSTIIEFIVFLLVKRLLNFHIPLGVLAQFIWIFIVLLIISAFTIVQLIIILRWNRNVEKAKQQRQTLALTNYKMINQISIIKFTIISILIFNLVFFWFYRQYTLPPRPDRLVIFLRIYTALRRLTWLLIFSYTIFEMWQLNKWIKRKKAVTRIEQKILEDLPKLQELANLTNTNVDTGSFDRENEEKNDDDESQTFFHN